jgi:alpha-D-xyloside xylohydrolase
MKRYCIYTLAAFLWLIPTVQSFGSNRGKNVTIQLKTNNIQSTRLVRLEVISDKIIHVSATPATTFSSEKSLIIVPSLQMTDKYTVTTKGSMLTVSTSSLRVNVDKNSGVITFTDPNGKLILSESANGRSFKPITVEGTKGYSIFQSFNSPKEEAFYGLGQHQANEYNYKDKNESLFQYNTKVSIPFIWSNRNYGILWDNYSYSKFGDPREFMQLNEAFTLYDKQGNAGGITATYTPADKNKKTIIRSESSICYEDIKTIKNLPSDFPLMGSNVCYEGMIQPKESGPFHFNLYYAGYIKVYVNGQLLVPERWRTAWNPNTYKFIANLKAGEKVKLRIEWHPDGSISYCGLRVLPPLKSSQQDKMSLWSEMGNEENYYFIYGKNPDEIISGYRTLTGKAQVMPQWAMGYWQSKERYKTAADIEKAVKTFRDKKIPLDVIVQDWYYWKEDDWGSHLFDKVRFPNPKEMIDSIHKMHAKYMISVWPKFYASTEHFKEFDRNGWMYRQAIKDSIRDWVGPGYIGSFYDAYSAGARKLFWKQINETLFPLKVDAWWMDASEPNIRDCTDLPYRKQLCGPTALGPSTKYFNAYALMNAEAIYNGQRSTDPDKRVLLLTRSGFAGEQRYSTATWSGDIASRWEDMKAQITAGLNFCMAGIPWWGMDIGGFCVENRYIKAYDLFKRTGEENADSKEWRELNTRWFQFGAFVPLYRAHGQYPDREIYNIAPKDTPTYQSILWYTNLRYRLLPYIYSLAGMVHFNDYTLMRGLIMDFEKDTHVNNIGDQYMFGPAFMVNPICQYEARERQVYLPATTTWYDFYTNKSYQGGQTITAEAPYERMPLYVRAGSIIPFGPALQYSDEKKPEKITIYVYGGQNGHFTLYEDEGSNYNYEKGKYATIDFTYNEMDKVLTIGNRKGSFDGMLTNRIFNVVLIDGRHTQAYDPDARGQIISYDGTDKIINFKK